MKGFDYNRFFVAAENGENALLTHMLSEGYNVHANNDLALRCASENGKIEKGEWKRQINVRDFIQKNYTPYVGDSSFLAGTTEKTKKLWNEVLELYKKEHDAKGGVLDIDTKTVSTVSAHDAGYIDKDLEEIVGL